MEAMEPTRCAPAVRGSAPGRRAFVAAGLSVLTMLATACGGGNSGPQVGVPGILLQVGTRVDGVVLDVSAFAGQEVALAIHPGQSIELDASEPVAWSVSVNGGPTLDAGNSVVVGGVTITESTVSPSRVGITTAVTGAAVQPVAVTLVATSVSDVAQVATVQLQVR
jgi:hypothetical protein